jgi:hypothetical protein
VISDINSKTASVAMELEVKYWQQKEAAATNTLTRVVSTAHRTPIVPRLLANQDPAHARSYNNAVCDFYNHAKGLQP